MVSLTHLSVQILGKAQVGVFPISGFLFNPLERKIVITLKPVMILTLNFDQVTKFDKRGTAMSKKVNGDVMSPN